MTSPVARLIIGSVAIWIACGPAVAQHEPLNDETGSLEVAEVSAEWGRQLNAEECHFIENYDARLFYPSFVDQFVYMTSRREICLDSRDLSCEPEGLHRRDTRLSFRLYGIERDEFENIEVFAANLEYMINFIADNSPINIVSREERVVEDMLDFVIIGEEEELYAAFDGPVSDYPAYEFLLNFPEIPCTANFDSESTSMAITNASVIIRRDLPPELFALCVKEEVYNSLGIFSDPIGDASLFDDDFGREPSLGYPIYEPFSIRDEIMLRLLYSDELEVGSDPDTVRRVVTGIIDRDCGE